MAAPPVFVDLGDTQPMESQVYKDYYTTTDASAVTGVLSNANPGQYETGDTGHVDLPTDFNTGNLQGTTKILAPQPMSPNAVSAADLMDINDSASQGEPAADTQGESATRTSSQQSSPTTPGTVVQETTHDEPLVRSTQQTPAPDYAAFFPGVKKLSAAPLSQIFHGTQADGTSPGNADPRSDPIFERPSPEYSRHPRSSPSYMMSSPAPIDILEQLRTSGEPRGSYMALNESQRQRDRQQRLEQLVSSPPALNSDEEREWDADSEQRRAERRRKRMQIKMEAMRDFEALAAPTTSRKIDKRRKIIPSETVIGLLPTASERRRKDIITISSDRASSQSPDSESHESVDAYDELSQSIMSSQRKPERCFFRTDRGVKTAKRKTDDAARPASSPLPAKSRDDTTSNYGFCAPFTAQYRSSSRQQRSLQDRNETREHSQIVAVFNSQPDQPLQRKHSSMCSRDLVSQSLVPSLSSNTKAYLTATPFDTSSAPRPSKYNQANSRQATYLANSSPPHFNSSSKRDREDNKCLASANVNEAADHANAANTLLSNCRSQSRRLGDENGVQSEAARPLSQGQPSGCSAVVLTDGSNQAVPETSPAATAKPQSCTSLPDSGPSEAARAETPLRNDSSLYETARSHQALPSKRSSIQQSPRTPRIRNMADIAATNLSPFASNSPYFDENLMGHDDVDFYTAISESTTSEAGPRRKLRRLNKSRSALTEPAKELNAKSKPSQSLGTKEVQVDSEVWPPPGADSPGAVTYTGSAWPSGSLQDTQSVALPIQHDKSPENLREIAETPQVATRENSNRFSNHQSVCSDERTLRSSQSPRRNSCARPPQLNPGPVVTKANANLKLPEAAVYINPKRVLARFNGQDVRYYPANCLGPANGTTSALKVRFDDDTVVCLERHLVKSLEFGVGDLVKVDLTGMRNNDFQVRGLKDKITKLSGKKDINDKTDIQGYSTLVLEPKLRSRWPNDHGINPQRIEVPVSSIYVTKTLWPRFKSRSSCFLSADPQSLSGVHTPLTGPSAPGTPSSRTRRHSFMQSGARGAKAVQRNGNDLFANMAFGLTFSSNNEDVKHRMTKLLLENGARVLSAGFDQLFNVPLPVLADKSLSSDSLEEVGQIRVCSSAKDLGFVALITDAHSRRTKYIQALALNIPCLSHCWVSDCLAKSVILPWDPYLLPAGESAFLGGAVRSRVFSSGPHNLFACAPSSRLSDTIQNRPQFFAGHSVILVISQAEERAAYSFLTYALGAKRVAQVANMSEARTLIDSGKCATWEWVYVGTGSAAEAKARLLSPEGAKKRKRSVDNEALRTEVELGRRKINVAVEEYVIQSLILGGLIES